MICIFVAYYSKKIFASRFNIKFTANPKSISRIRHLLCYFCNVLLSRINLLISFRIFTANVFNMVKCSRSTMRVLAMTMPYFVKISVKQLALTNSSF